MNASHARIIEFKIKFKNNYLACLQQEICHVLPIAALGYRFLLFIKSALHSQQPIEKKLLRQSVHGDLHGELLS